MAMLQKFFAGATAKKKHRSRQAKPTTQKHTSSFLMSADSRQIYTVL
jgi:hypothetical protein